MRLVIVDFGSGNLRSVEKALERSGLSPVISADANAITTADAVVLPGVGAFADAALALKEKKLDVALRSFIDSGKPYLGICLGLQLLFESSDEHGTHAGLGVLKGHVRRFDPLTPEGKALRIPHIGWNRVAYCGQHPMLAMLPKEDHYYFVHSYRAIPQNRSDVAGVVEYGSEHCAAVAKDNVFAVQFHPEKSQQSGKRLLDAFAGWIRS